MGQDAFFLERVENPPVCSEIVLRSVIPVSVLLQQVKGV
jgi:hypothetical protein